MISTETEVAQHLRKQAEKLENLATEYESRKHPKAKECRDRAISTRDLAQKIDDNYQDIIQELSDLTQLINACNNNGHVEDTCSKLLRLIEKFLLNNKEPYATHYHNCGGR